MVSKDKCILCNNPDTEDTLSTEQLCEECLEDIHKCEQCGINQPYCSDCV
jgi:hypothetical protein